MDGLWFLLAIALLRFVWRFIERAARKSGEPDPAERPEERKAQRAQRQPRPVAAPRPERDGTRSEPVPQPAERRRQPAPRRRPEPQRQVRPEPTAYTPAEAQRPSPRNDLLERLREVMEAASGTRPDPPTPVPIPMPAPEHRPPPVREESAPRDTRPSRATEREREVVPTASHETSRARDLQQLLRDPSSIREALLLREVLGPPVAHRRAPRARHRM